MLSAIAFDQISEHVQISKSADFAVPEGSVTLRCTSRNANRDIMSMVDSSKIQASSTKIFAYFSVYKILLRISAENIWHFNQSN